ncbi:MAG: enoyl-CoA hydratase/isomerase family protein, partial [Actinobacteria bacterium]|nr:enoyl-CoA hydratase/isomerase family protein [Actinomycetota bacterium]
MTLTPPLAGLTAAEDHLVVRWHEPGIAHVVLSNPDQRNAMSAAMTQAWSLAMSELAELPGLRAVLVSGEGKAFCAGGDLGWLAEGGSEGIAVLSRRMDDFYSQWLSVTELSVPTIAYLDGPAVGAGAAVALACDIRWAGPRARFSVPFTRLGLHSGMGTTYLLPHAVG